MTGQPAQAAGSRVTRWAQQIEVADQATGMGCAFALTALVHLGLAGMTVAPLSPRWSRAWAEPVVLSIMAALFACNFGGYVILGTALRLPTLSRHQPAVRWALIAFTAVTILAYVVLAAGPTTRSASRTRRVRHG